MLLLLKYSLGDIYLQLTLSFYFGIITVNSHSIIFATFYFAGLIPGSGLQNDD